MSERNQRPRFHEEVRYYGPSESESISDAAGAEEEFYYRQRTTSLHRNLGRKTMTPKPESTLDWINTTPSNGKVPLEKHADHIVRKIENDLLLMDDSKQAEQLRKETLRDMPQSLTMKRRVKYKLGRNLSAKTDTKSIGCFKCTVYNTEIFFAKFKAGFYNFLYTFELWYSVLKRIEGQFGSAVAVYFRFFRWIFLFNLFTFLPSLFFIVLPQIFFNGSDNGGSFHFKDIFTGDGYLKETIIFYGFYTNETISGSEISYNMPQAYFFTMMCTYLFVLLVLSVCMARSYRRNFIETKGGLKNVFAHKVFCGWDYSIATDDAARLKSSSIFNELKELMHEYNRLPDDKTCVYKFWTLTIQLVFNLIVLGILGALGYLVWVLLGKDKGDAATTGIIIAVVINVIILVVPLLFSFIAKFEDYRNPRTSFRITLARTFLLELVVIGVLIGYWVTHAEEQCWETSLGQEIYRLAMFEFLFSIALLLVTEIARSVIYKHLWKGVGVPEFNIARYAVQLTYNQTLFWVGLYFAPLLAVVTIIKLFIMWYLVTRVIIYFCKPSSRSWRAAQTQTWFLMLSFICLMLVLIVLGYIVARIKPSDMCGPFRSNEHVYDVLRELILTVKSGPVFWKILLYIFKPAVVALILIAMCVGIYYLRAKAQAQDGMIRMLRMMLIYETKDKEFLLHRISQGNHGKWQYNLTRNPEHEKDSNYALVNRKKRHYREDEDTPSSILLPADSTEASVHRVPSTHTMTIN